MEGQRASLCHSYFRSILSSQRHHWAWAEYLSPAPALAATLDHSLSFTVRNVIVSLLQPEFLIDFYLFF